MWTVKGDEGWILESSEWRVFENSDANTTLMREEEFVYLGVYLWGRGLSRREEDGHPESSRACKVDGKVPVPIPCKLEDAVHVFGGQMDRNTGKEIN